MIYFNYYYVTEISKRLLLACWMGLLSRYTWSLRIRLSKWTSLSTASMCRTFVPISHAPYRRSCITWTCCCIRKLRSRVALVAPSTHAPRTFLRVSLRCFTKGLVKGLTRFLWYKLVCKIKGTWYSILHRECMGLC